MRLDGLLRDADTTIATRCAARGLALSVEACPPAATARADADKLRQILLNLLSNAVKFTPAGGTVALERALDGDQARLRVRDTGVGIPNDKLD